MVRCYTVLLLLFIILSSGCEEGVVYTLPGKYHPIVLNRNGILLAGRGNRFKSHQPKRPQTFVLYDCRKQQEKKVFAEAWMNSSRTMLVVPSSGTVKTRIYRVSDYSLILESTNRLIRADWHRGYTIFSTEDGQYLYDLNAKSNVMALPEGQLHPIGDRLADRGLLYDTAASRISFYSLVKKKVYGSVPAKSFTLSANGSRLLVPENDSSSVFDTETGRLLFRLPGANLSFSSSGRFLYSDKTGELIIHSADSGKKMLEITGSRPAFSPGGKMVAFATGGQATSFVSLGGRAAATNKMFTIPGRVLGFSTNWQYAVVSRGGRQVALWDLQKRKKMDVFKRFYHTLSRNGIFVFREKGGIRVWDTASGGGGTFIRHVFNSPALHRLRKSSLYITSDLKWQRYNLKEKKISGVFPGRLIQLAGDETAAIISDGGLYVYDLNMEEKIGPLPGYPIAFLDGSKTLAVRGKEGKTLLVSIDKLRSDSAAADLVTLISIISAVLACIILIILLRARQKRQQGRCLEAFIKRRDEASSVVNDSVEDCNCFICGSKTSEGAAVAVRSDEVVQSASFQEAVACIAGSLENRSRVYVDIPSLMNKLEQDLSGSVQLSCLDCSDRFLPGVVYGGHAASIRQSLGLEQKTVEKGE